MEVANERTYLDAKCMEDGVQQEAMWCQEALSRVLDITAKKNRMCAMLKRWWNGDIKPRR